MLSIKLVYIYILLFIIFITLCFSLNILISKNTDIVENINIISMIAIIIIIIFIIYFVFTYKPKNKILKEYDNKIKLEKKSYLDNNLIINKYECNKPKIIKKSFNIHNEDNYQNLLHSEFIDELENEQFYKTNDDYHNIEKYVYDNYLSKFK